MLGQSISKNSVILGVFALFTAGVLAATFNLTKDRIQEEERKAAQKALLEIIPRDRHDNEMLEDTLSVGDFADLLNVSPDESIHIARMGGLPIAYIFPAIAPDGYSGAIKLIIGVNVDGSIAGVRVLAHKETPGLGDKIDLNKDDWILDFTGKSLSNPQIEEWKVKKDGGQFDQFTGATITPRAVVNKVKQALLAFSEKQPELSQKVTQQALNDAQRNVIGEVISHD